MHLLSQGGGNSHVSNHLQHRPRMATVALLLLTFSFFNITSARADVCDNWLTDGTGLNHYAGIYRILCPMNIPPGGYLVNIQLVDGTPAIYFGNMGTVTDCSLGTSNYTVKGGGGLYLHLSALTSHYTEVTITSGGVNYTFTVEYKNGGKLYFVKPTTWNWSNVYAHMWNNGGGHTTWPGVEMSTNEQVTLEKCTADIYEVAYNSAYNKLKFNDNGSKGIDNLDIPGEDMYYVPSIMSNATDVTNWKWCASHDVNLRIGDAANNYYTDESSHKFAFAQGSGHTLTTTVTLAANTVYYFKLEQTQENKWYTHHDASNKQMTSSNCTDWDMAYNGENDAPTKILTTEPGEYTFTYDYTSDRLSVTYPSGMATSTACSGISDEVIEPATPFYYAYDFSTLPNGDVQIQFEWLGDGEPANIYFHDYTSGNMAESSMDRSGKVGTKTITGKSTGDILIFGCKFDKSGVYRTRRFVYKVGYDCGEAECGEKGNIAAGKLAKAGYSRMYDAGRGGRNEVEQPQMALDGKTTTHFIAWGAGGADQDAYRWWAVDLGAEYNLDNVKIYWQEEGRSSANYILQTRSDLSADFENDAAYSNTGWTTIKTVTEKQTIGSANSYDVKGQGRYLRLVANDRINIAISEFEVYVSGCVSDDSNPPTMVSATYVSNNDGNTGVILELKATDLEGEVSRFRLDEEGGGSTFVNTDGSHRATLDGIASGSHTYHVYAIDGAGNVSANYEELSFCFLNPAENLALNKTAKSGWSRTVTEVNSAETPDKAVDGYKGSGATTRPDGTISEHRQWEINTNYPTKAWWAVDLGNKYQLSDIDIYWPTGTDGNVPRSYIIQVATETPADFVNDGSYQNLDWETVTTVTNTNQNVGTGSANRNRYSYTAGQKVMARYVRIVNKDDSRTAMYISEVEVYAHAANCDNEAPVMISAGYDSRNGGNTGVIVELHGDDATSDDAITKFKLVEMDGSTPVEAIYLTTNAQHKVEIDDLSTGTHTYHVYAIDVDGNVSANYEELSFCFVNSSVNLALYATTSAGHTENDASATTANAVDGDNDTQWNGTGATAGTDEWFMVDLGRTYDLREVKILWSKTGETDDGGTYPVNYKLQGSNNGTDFYTFAHYSSKTETGQWLDYTTTDPLPAQYVRVWVDQHSTYAMGIRELEVYSKDECFVEQEPVITFAEITNLTPSGVTVSCDAYANTTNMAGMRFYYELTNTGTGSKTTTGTLTHTDGSITVTGLEPNINYSLKIYAEITSSSARSANYKELTFNLTYSSLHYLTEETECNWQAGLYNTEWQFAFTDRYSPTEVDKGGAPLRILSFIDHTIINDVATTPPTIQYKLYEAGYGGIWTSGGNLFFRNPKDKPLKMYALGTEKFVCNLDELYVSGDAVGSWWETTYTPNRSEAANYQMRYDDETGLFSWTGDVVPGTGKYFKIVIRDLRGVDATADTWAYNRIMQANATYDREWTRATLYFDMSTWTWWWESAMDGCVREGGPGVVNTDNGGQEFTDGYKLNSYVVTEDGKRYFVVEAEPLDAELNNAILHIYKDESAAVTEVGKDGDAKTYKVGSTTHTYYRFKKLVSDIPGAINGIIRYYVKFEGQAGIIRNTKYHYYDLNKNECAPDTWIIYHHGQAPDGERETFDGGQIVQPIEYRRKFDLDKWYSLYLPFEVTAVKVISGGTYYDLLPYYRKADGTLKGKQYIIRKATPVTDMPIANVENRLPSESPNGWFDPSESEYTTFLPQKNTPYIIQFHNAYYADKWIAFFGRWYSTIDTDFPANAAPTSDEVVNIYGNNTMKNQSLSGQCYQLNYDEYDSYAWTRFDDVTLYPFECYILANATTTAKYRILRRGAAEDTPTGMEDVYEESVDIRVYTIAGQYLCTLHNMSPDEAGQHLQSRLTEGVYILRTPALSYKLIIGGL